MKKTKKKKKRNISQDRSDENHPTRPSHSSIIIMIITHKLGNDEPNDNRDKPLLWELWSALPHTSCSQENKGLQVTMK